MKTAMFYLAITGLITGAIAYILFSTTWYVSLDPEPSLTPGKSSDSIVSIQENKDSVLYFDHSLYYLPHQKSYLHQTIQKKVTPLKSSESVPLHNFSIPITKRALFQQKKEPKNGLETIKKDLLDSQIAVFNKIGQIPPKPPIKRNHFAILQILNYQNGQTKKYNIPLEDRFNDLHQKQWEPFVANVLIRKGAWFGGALLERSSNQEENQKEILKIVENSLNWIPFTDGYYQIKIQK